MNTPNNLCVDVCAALPINGTAANASKLGGISADSYALKSELNSLSNKVALQSWYQFNSGMQVWCCISGNFLIIQSISSLVTLTAQQWTGWFTLSGDFSFIGNQYIPCAVGTTVLRPALLKVEQNGWVSVYCHESISNESIWFYAAIPIRR